MQAPLLRHPIEEAASPSDREIDSNQKHAMSDHGKNLFIEQHKDGYAILRGGVNEPLAVEPTQDATIEKARKLEPDAASMWSGFATSERGGRDKCGGSDRHQAAPRFLGFFCARLSCRAATRSITLLRYRGELLITKSHQSFRYDLKRPKVRIKVRYERTDIDAARPQFRC